MTWTTSAFSPKRDVTNLPKETLTAINRVHWCVEEVLVSPAVTKYAEHTQRQWMVSATIPPPVR